MTHQQFVELHAGCLLFQKKYQDSFLYGYILAQKEGDMVETLEQIKKKAVRYVSFCLAYLLKAGLTGSRRAPEDRDETDVDPFAARRSDR